MRLVVDLVRQVHHDHGQADGAGDPDRSGQQRGNGDGADGEIAQTDIAEQMFVVGTVRADPVMSHSGKVRVEGSREHGLPEADDQSEQDESPQQQLDGESHAGLR